MSTASWTMGTALEPVHDVLEMSTVAAALAPDKQAFYHMVAHGTDTGTLVASGKASGMLVDCT